MVASESSMPARCRRAGTGRRHYCSLAEASDRELRGPGQAAALERVAASGTTSGPRSSGCSTTILGAGSRSCLRSGCPGSCAVTSRRVGDASCCAERADREPSEARASAFVGAGLFADDEVDQRRSLNL